MSKRILKKITALICIMILVLPISSEVLAKITTTEIDKPQTFGIVHMHESEYLNDINRKKNFGYKVDERKVYRIYSGSDNAEGYLNTILCLDKDGKFPGEDSKNGAYTSRGPAEEALKNIQTNKNGTKTNLSTEDIQKIIWLTNNAVLPEDSEGLINIKLAKIFEASINATKETENPLTLDYIKEILTKDDLVFALQATIWSITNPSENPSYQGTNDGTYYNALFGNDGNGGRQGAYIQIIKDYYEANYMSNKNIVASKTDDLCIPKITAPKKLVFTDEETELAPEDEREKGITDNDYIFVGPFRIDPSEENKNTVDYSIDLIFKDINKNTISSDTNKMRFYIKEQPNTAAKGLTLTKESIEGKDFYIALKKGTTVRYIDIKLNSANIISDSQSTVWTVKDNEEMQPLISIEREESQTENVEIEYGFDAEYQRKFDIALRKNIVAIYRKGDDFLGNWSTDITPQNQRRTIKGFQAEEGSFNQYQYNHQKAPIEVEVGDIVKYNIRVCNEGKYATKIQKVIDYIPATGLELLENGWEDGKHTVTYSGYKVTKMDPKNGKPIQIIIEPTNQDAIKSTLKGTNAVGVTKPDCLDIILEFRVTEEAKGRIITNIAEVAEFKGQEDENGDGNGEGPWKQVTDCDSTPNNIKLPETEQEWEDYKGNGINKDDLNDKDYYYKGQEDDDDFEKIILPGEKKPDLALRKSIVAVNGTPKDRQKEPDTTPIINREATTSKFNDEKEVLPVKVGDKITYTIRVFNEGSIDAYATKISDYIPEGLGFLPNYTDNITNKWTVNEDGGGTIKKLSDIPNATSNFQGSDFTANGIDDYKNQNVICGKACIETDKLKDTLLKPLDKSTGKLDIKTVQITCVVLEMEDETVIRNVAAITGYADENKQEITHDKTDSYSNNDLTNFDENNHEDDEDYEKIKIDNKELPYDLALKKFVSSVSDGTNTPKTIPDNQKRNLTITSVEQLKSRQDAQTKADATYSFGLDKDPNPVKIEKGDYVTYTIRIYNEGLIDGSVKELIDTVPEGLTFLPESTINKKYGWEEFSDEMNTGWKAGVKTTILKDTTIKAFDADKENESNYDQASGTGIDKGVSYAEVKIEFKVNDKAKDSVKIKNIAEITEDDNDDNDSTPDNKDPEEDDEDFDVIIPSRFDLALRKFITKIEDKPVTDRVPEVDTTNLDNRTSTTAKYKHPKQEDTKVVVTGQIVEYTIRVYNEGTEDGYASEIKDDIPEGLEFLPEHKTNIDNKWKMYDKDGNETQDTTKAVSIRTDAKSKENSKERKGDESNAYNKPDTNLIKAYNPDTMKDGPDYVEVKVAFKVIKTNVTDGNTVIINTAEITKETDKNGDEVVDTDSTPDNNNPDEDDIDKEYLQLKYFDLSLLKYVSKVIVTEDGVTKETETGYDGTENPEPVVKVELNKNKLAQTQVKYVYTIKVTNEGQIEGYAKEITDRIPAGLSFHAEDNKATGWGIKETGVITTDHLKDTLLKPGESATVQVVLRWENSESNLGQKVNVAEISLDKNEYDIPDIDSTPGNNKDGEDDQDEAIVVLSIKTGSAPVYIVLITIVTAILGTGFYLIYKYVVKR